MRSIRADELIQRLDDFLCAVNQDRDEAERYAGSTRGYLDDWAHYSAGWLRKYYPVDSDEPHYDATGALEKARWRS